jgi:hypothetical protein
MVERINHRKGSNIDLEQLKKYADRCLANEWIEHIVMGVGKYGQLSITTTGLGVVRSRQRKEEALSKRTLFKKILRLHRRPQGFLYLNWCGSRNCWASNQIVRGVNHGYT